MPKQIDPETLEMLQLRVGEERTKTLYEDLTTCLFCLWTPETRDIVKNVPSIALTRGQQELD
jgi:hypothetical protein